MHVVGTAGHVDHGKSSLVRALTGVDPDRWQEEKDRGLTIDLGFAELQLPSGRTADIVDVPGHERFIKNMLAGAGGIDLALLVVAADGGIMPQTREHLAIIDLLGIGHGVVAITRADLADATTIEKLRGDVGELLAETALGDAQIVACSATTGEGLDKLMAAIDKALATAPVKRDVGRPRLPIDRAFTMTGFGTVVTGTLVDGSIAVGETVEIAPAGLSARIRGIQNHGRSVEQSAPGSRTALNLSGVSPEELERGMVVVLPGRVAPVTTLDVQLQAVPCLTRPIRHNLAVTVHTGAAEASARMVLLDSDDVGAGQTAWAQLRLASPIAALAGDRLIVRDSNSTLGGGRIVDVNPPRHRRFHAVTIETLERAAHGTSRERLFAWIEGHQPTTIEATAEAFGGKLTDALIAGLQRESAIVVLEGSVVYTLDGYAAAVRRVEQTLEAFHKRTPLRAGMPRSELRQRLGLTPHAFDALLAALSGNGTIRDSEPVALASFKPNLSPAQLDIADGYVAVLRSLPYSPPTDTPVDGDLLAYLVAAGEVIDAGDGIVFAATAYADMTDSVLEHIRTRGPITLAQVRDMFGTTRKYAQALLETMDRQHLTRRVGDERILYRTEG